MDDGMVVEHRQQTNTTNKFDFIGALLIISCMLTFPMQAQNRYSSVKYDTIRTNSHLGGLQLALLHRKSGADSGRLPILFIHGSSFPSVMAFGFRMSGYSWMDYFSSRGYESFALDFLGYGNSDRYPGMESGPLAGNPVGRASEVWQDIDLAVDYIRSKTGSKKVILIAHSWGGSVSSLYTSKFSDKIERLVLFAPITPRSEKGAGEIIRAVYHEMSPDDRVAGMASLVPQGHPGMLEKEVYREWKKEWLESDPQSITGSGKVRFPAGPAQDVEDLRHNRSYYNPESIKVPVLIIRGEWDSYPSDEDARSIFSQLRNSPDRKYVVIEKGTHVMHLEKTRILLYKAVSDFLVNANEK